jgi:hypothetical protein
MHVFLLAKLFEKMHPRNGWGMVALCAVSMKDRNPFDN